MIRSELEILALMRRRNGAIFRWLSLILFITFAGLAFLNLQSGGARHGPELRLPFFYSTASQSFVFLLFFLISQFFRKFFRRRATVLFTLGCFYLISMQGLKLFWSQQHSPFVTFIVFVGFGVLLQIRFRNAVPLFLALYAIPTGMSVAGGRPPLNTLPVTIGGPVIAMMAVFIQNMIVKQSLTIRANNRALSRNNRQISGLKKAQDLILDTVAEGLFVINPELRIGTQYSAALPGILGEAAPAGKSFPDLIAGGMGRAAGDEIARFLRLVFRPHVTAPALIELNPLAEAAFRDASGADKILSFRFSRIMRGQQIVGVLAVVQDFTEQKRLQAEMAEREAGEQNRMQLIFRLVQIDADMLGQFLDDVRRGSRRISELLDERPNDDFTENAAEIFRVIHAIKGNASVLDLEFFEIPAHEFEEALLSSTSASSDDFREHLRGHLRTLQDRVAEVDDLIGRLSRFRDSVIAGGSPGDFLIRTMESLVDRLGRDLNRRVKIRTTGLKKIDASEGALLRDVLVQLARNSIMHGLEAPEERARAGKDETGLIEILSENGDHHSGLVFRDDGRGLDIDRIRRKAAASGRWTAAELADFSNEQIANLIFEPGFSTAREVSLHAGRGIGLDLVKSRLKEAGGSISARSRPGRFCEFRISLKARG